MGVDFTVFKGSKTGEIVEATGHREPGPTEVLVKITHCGVCGTDEHYRHNDQGLGHEGIGTIIEVGSAVGEVSDFRVGDRVGMGWHYKHCGHCKACVTGAQNDCENPTFFGTANQDQGCFGTAVAWDVSALFKIPKEIASEDAGPLMCGGATVWAPLFNFGARPGDRIGIIGVGGLGHLAIQFASKMGMEAVVFSTTESKRQKAMEFGASEFHATAGVEKFEGIAKLDMLLITSNVLPNMSLYIPIMRRTAQMFPLTVSTEIIPLSPLSFIMSGVKVVGSTVASVGDLRAMLAFAAKNGVKPQIEKFPLTKAGITEAMQKLSDGNMRYRGVLVAA